MIVQSSYIQKNTSLTEDLFVLELEFSQSIQAGQFVMIKVPQTSKILPRPISVFDYKKSSQTLSLLIRQRGEGTKILSQLQKGDKIDLFGGMGQGFPSDHKNQKILLMGGGEGIAPMLLTSKLLKKENNIEVLGGFRYEIESSVFDYFDRNLKISYTAQDHSNQNFRGMITNLLEDREAPDFIYSCGPIPMMKAIYHTVLSKNWHTKVYVSMESHMACGVGACMGCTIKDKLNNPVKVCTEGPVFLAEEVFHV